eukprot:5396908-Amphidinium_carterae.1
MAYCIAEFPTDLLVMIMLKLTRLGGSLRIDLPRLRKQFFVLQKWSWEKLGALEAQEWPKTLLNKVEMEALKPLDL